MKFEKMKDIFENLVNENLAECRGNNIEEMFGYLADLGFSKKDALDFVDRYYLNEIKWAEEDPELEANEKVNTETGEGIFWKEYTEDEDVNNGDNDQAILETALIQIGIPYTCEKSMRDGTEYEWIELKIVDDGKVTENTAAEIYFTKDGKFDGLY